jgi:Spy/CpxP family protein refolding chaperone
MKIKIAKVLLTSVFAVSCMFAQGTQATQTTHTPPDPATIAQRRVAHLTRLLTLTTAQQQQATNIFTNSATADVTARTNLHTAHQALRDAIKKNDTAAIDQSANTIGTLTGQLAASDGKANAAFYLILTPDQQTKLAALKSQHGGHGMFGGAQGFRSHHGQ